MRPRNYSPFFSEWTVNPETGTFHSPSKEAEPPGQIVVFDSRVKDGSISASLVPISGQWNKEWNYEFRECAMMFRFTDLDHFYLAGIGGFGRKFFIARISLSEWRLLADSGLAQDLKSDVPYHLRTEFHGDRITLFHNGVPVLRAVDSTYSSGFCGLRSNRTEAIFENVDISAVKPKCFVIMPFAPELNFVFNVIKEAVEQQDLECVRADERFVSEPIIENVKSQIAGAEVVIVDFTGRNPNVYFEAGLADAWRKKWIVLAQSTSDLAFDVQHVRAIVYSNTMGADQKLKTDIGRALQETLTAAGPVTDAGSPAS